MAEANFSCLAKVNYDVPDFPVLSVIQVLHRMTLTTRLVKQVVTPLLCTTSVLEKAGDSRAAVSEVAAVAAAAAAAVAW